MTHSEHGKRIDIVIDDSFSASLEELFEEVVVLDSNNGRHEDVDFMAMHFEGVVPEQLGDSIVSLHDLGLGVFVSTYYYDGCIFRKHHLEVVHMLIKGFRPRHCTCLVQKLFAFCAIVLDLYEIVSINLESFGIIGINSD